METAGCLPPRPRGSIVITARNEAYQLRLTVGNQIETIQPGDRELIVIDDGSTDGSTAFLHDLPEVLVRRSEGLGVARARNFGASQATGDIILFADAHVRAPEGWYEPVTNALRRQAVGAVAPGIYSMTEPARRGFGLVLTGPDLHASWRPANGREPHNVPVLPGCFLAMRREVFERTGGFDPGMRRLGGNDAEISCRLWLLGYELLVVPEVEVGHLFRTVAPYDADWTSVVHNRLRMAFVHFGPQRVERVVDALRAYQAFPAAMSLMLDTDVQQRRARLAADRCYDDEWFCQKFTLPC
jgi:glycosyltransferase involved in cell wall biosynthesis